MIKNKLSPVLIIVLLVFTACVWTPNKTMEVEANFSGTIEEIYENSILVRVDEEEEEFKSSDLMIVSLNTEQANHNPAFNVGDQIVVYYDGNIAESYPAQIHRVYMITSKNSKE